MRKIEMPMNTAIKNNTDWYMSNTRVDNNEGVSTVYLHGNKIAEIGEQFVRIRRWLAVQHHQIPSQRYHQRILLRHRRRISERFAWYIRDNKVVHDFVNGYTFAEFA